jgi:hypothetical protein
MGDESARPDAVVRDTTGTRDAAGTQRRIVVPDEVRATFGLPASQRAAALAALAEPKVKRETVDRGETAVALFEMHALPPGPTTGIIPIELTVDLTAHAPYLVLGGTLGGDIYTGPLPDEHWEVIYGAVGISTLQQPPPQTPPPAQDAALYVTAERVRITPAGSGEAEAQLVGNGPRAFSMMGFFWPPATFQGAWTYAESEAWYPCITLFIGWRASPPL